MFAWVFLRVAPPTQQIGKILPSCPQNKFSPKMFFGLQGMAWEGSEGGLWHFANDLDTEKPFFAPRSKSLHNCQNMGNARNHQHKTFNNESAKCKTVQPANLLTSYFVW